MRKTDELMQPSSCINKSRPDEWVFVLCARDPHAPAAVRKWADDYERAGGNPEKAESARWTADQMEQWRLAEQAAQKGA